MSLYVCPVCGHALMRTGGILQCQRRHSFDVSASGYVNLLTGGKPGASPGDSKEMCAARNQFLSKGYYACLASALAEWLAAALCEVPSPVLVDAACGEGFYTAALFGRLAQNGGTPRAAGVDLSKHALKYAAKRDARIEFAAASIFAMPLPDACAQAVTNIFAPVAEAEFRRVLAPGGFLVIVGPGPQHLWELKEFLYEKPYLNEPKHYDFAGFAPVETLRVQDRITLTDNADLLRLFAMTPYLWKTPREAVERLHGLQTLALTLCFEVHIFQKK